MRVAAVHVRARARADVRARVRVRAPRACRAQTSAKMAALKRRIVELEDELRAAKAQCASLRLSARVRTCARRCAAPRVSCVRLFARARVCASHAHVRRCASLAAEAATLRSTAARALLEAGRSVDPVRQRARHSTLARYA